MPRPTTTLIVNESASFCANCRANVQPSDLICVECKAVYIAVGTEMIAITDRMIDGLNNIRPDLPFIGYLPLDNGQVN